MRENPFDIVLYGRNKCHLCEEVELMIRCLSEEFPLRLQVVDIEADPILHEQLMLVIPAVAIDGELVFRSVTHVVTMEELRRELEMRSAE